ncbi:MAG: hypothetical protein ACMG6E_06335, partial [Candidatus Roizmanbacteria bacterium]
MEREPIDNRNNFADIEAWQRKWAMLGDLGLGQTAGLLNEYGKAGITDFTTSDLDCLYGYVFFRAQACAVSVGGKDAMPALFDVRNIKIYSKSAKLAVENTVPSDFGIIPILRNLSSLKVNSDLKANGIELGG